MRASQSPQEFMCTAIFLFALNTFFFGSITTHDAFYVAFRIRSSIVLFFVCDFDGSRLRIERHLRANTKTYNTIQKKKILKSIFNLQTVRQKNFFFFFFFFSFGQQRERETGRVMVITHTYTKSVQFLLFYLKIFSLLLGKLQRKRIKHWFHTVSIQRRSFKRFGSYSPSIPLQNIQFIHKHE